MDEIISYLEQSHNVAIGYAASFRWLALVMNNISTALCERSTCILYTLALWLWPMAANWCQYESTLYSLPHIDTMLILKPSYTPHGEENGQLQN